MKYNESNKPLVCMQTQSNYYKNASNMVVKGVLWHSTGDNNPYIKRYVQPSDNDKDRINLLNIIGTNANKNDWNHIIRNSGVNGWVGKLNDGTVGMVQAMPWNYKSHYCGRGKNGSCDNGWIQFEICEDNLQNAKYFKEIYKEICEVSAYICKLYKLNPKGVVKVDNIEVPVVLSHAEAFSLGLGSEDTDIDNWLMKYGKTMDDVREEVMRLVEADMPHMPIIETKIETYRVRKSWEDAASQVGKALTDLEKAKKVCNAVGKEYEVYNDEGIAIYPESVVPKAEEITLTMFKNGDEVKLMDGATDMYGAPLASWMVKYKYYVKSITGNKAIISTQKTGSTNYAVPVKYLSAVVKESKIANGFEPYLVRVANNTIYVRAGAGSGYKINGKLYLGEAHTIVEEKNGWGKLKSGMGWILLNKTHKM
jgi:hypothetical protein